MKTIPLLGIDTNAKTIKGQKKGYMTAIMYLAPAKESGVMNTCPSASAGCKAACLFTAGHGGMTRADGTNIVRDARIKRTVFLKEHKEHFMAQLREEITAFIKKAEKKDLIPVVRLNGTSDIPWEHPNFGILNEFPNIQFYDYTKIAKRALAWAKGEMPDNYHLTFSWNEEQKNHENAELIAQAGGNIAVVFSTKHYPDTFLGLPVVNGDESDLRFLDGKGAVVGLYAKGKAKKDTTGFVIQLDAK